MLATLKQRLISGFKWVLKHWFLTLLAGYLLYFGGNYLYDNYFSAANSGEVTYKTSAVAVDSIVKEISGSGQVVSENQIEVKPKAGGVITDIKIKKGSAVKAGDVLMVIDNSDAWLDVQSAELSLESAQLDLQELLAEPNNLELLQAQNSVQKAKDDLASLHQEYLDAEQDALDDLTKNGLTQDSEIYSLESSVESLENDLAKSYDDAFNDIVDAYVDLPDMLNNLEEVLYGESIAEDLYGSNIADNQTALSNDIAITDRYDFENIIERTKQVYEDASSLERAGFEKYLDTSRYAVGDELKALVDETVVAAKMMSELAKVETSMFDYWVNYREARDMVVYDIVTDYQDDLNDYSSVIGSHLSSLLSAQNSIDQVLDSLESKQRDLAEAQQTNPMDASKAERSLADLRQSYPIKIRQAETSLQEKELSLADLMDGADFYDIKSKQLSVKQKQQALLEAQKNLNAYTVVSPIDGVVAEVSVDKGEDLASGTAVLTLIADTNMAEVALNEVDAVQVELGQNVVLTFDAIEDLTISGKVADIDLIGTVSQGVVSYSTSLSFDVNDDRIKPGMTVNAAIIVESKMNVLTVPLASVKTNTSDESNYVEVLGNNVPVKKTVTVGVSNDTSIEIVEGLSEGELVITQTVNASTASSSTTSASSSTQQGSPPDAGFMMMR